jgi:2-dehydro-3-deoxygluconokinase
MNWIPSKDGMRWDLVSLGEVMLRLDPGDMRIATSRSFRVWEGGGEYNVARALRRCFGFQTAIVSALADNPVGRLLEELVAQGGVDRDYVQWRAYDGIGATVRNGLNFVERGFGVRPALSCSDRANSAASQLAPGDVDWDEIFRVRGTRWFHCGGIFAALSETTAALTHEALTAARENGIVTSFDINFRASLWKGRGGVPRAVELNRRLAGLIDVLIGNEEDFAVGLGHETALQEGYVDLEVDAYRDLLKAVRAEFPQTRVLAVTLREATTATRNRWTAACLADDGFHVGSDMPSLEIYDRVGGGDSFASGLIFGLLEGRDAAEALNLGIAHGALAMTTPGDTSMATRAEVERLALNAGAPARIDR